MKKLLILGSTFAMGLCAVGIAVGVQAREVKADDADSSVVAALIRGYMNEGKQYTKKSQIFLTEEEKINQVDLFHAKHNVLERTTYYDETVNALLMGDFDGGFDDIKSGYAAKGDNMVHYYYTGDGSETADLFTARNEDYTVKNTNPNEYFVTLTDLADLAADISWTTDGSSYYHNFGAEDKEKEDAEVLKAFQYFAAPMLLENTRYNPKYIRVAPTAKFLSVRIYDTASDLGYVTLSGGTEALLSEARVYSGLSFNPTNRDVVLKGSFDSWGEGYPFVYEPGFDDVEQYKVTVDLAKDNEVKVVMDGSWQGAGTLENQTYFTGEGNNNMWVSAYGKFDIYWKANLYKTYVGSVARELSFDSFDNANFFQADAAYYCWTWGKDYNNAWIPLQINDAGTGLSGSFASVDGLIIFRRLSSAGAPTATNWDDIDWSNMTGRTKDVNINSSSNYENISVEYANS
ncbi:MAG: hypothetical protein IJU64_01330 [Bacilli bacterium]|nr:hypothetical protein [Bacilli bacterium]